jgi:hypothetical protein
MSDTAREGESEGGCGEKLGHIGLLLLETKYSAVIAAGCFRLPIGC